MRPRTDEFMAAVEEASREIRDPVAKLRFVRGAAARRHAVAPWVAHVPWAPLRRRLYVRQIRVTGGRVSLGDAPPPDAAPAPARGLAASRALVAAAALAVALAAAGVGWRAAQPPAPPPLMAAPVATLAPVPEASPANPYEPLAARGIAPAAIWLVEKGAGFEQYSNGLRIDTTRTTAGTAREFRLFGAGGMAPEVHTRPIGILFHTSESDVWPLEASFNASLKGSSDNLIRYVRRHKLYHSVIDRFGRVYRVVDEAAKANHAGNSIWEDRGRIVLNLNHAFLGVSFETRWEGGRALPITRAQFSAGRDLADHLRQKYAIEPGMCVSHGLTSVNPKKYLIGHHVDWARGFPFEAFGLPDQYQRPAPSVALFGFWYDEDLVTAMGEPWPGVHLAREALAREAAAAGRDIQELRDEKRARYDEWVAKQSREGTPPVENAGG